MINSEENARVLAGLVVPCIGRLVTTGDGLEPYRLLDADGGVVEPVSVFLRTPGFSCRNMPTGATTAPDGSTTRYGSHGERVSSSRPTRATTSTARSRSDSSPITAGDHNDHLAGMSPELIKLRQ